MQGSHNYHNEHKNPSPPLVCSSSVTNDGTLSAIVCSKSLRSLDVPFQSSSTPAPHEDEMLSWLHYPANDPLDKGYCSDMFGDLPTSSRHSVGPLGFKQLPSFPLLSSASLAFTSGILAVNQVHSNRNTLCESSTREALESCGSRPAEASSWAAEASRGVAGADAVVTTGGGRVTDLASSHAGLELLSNVDSSGGEVLSKVGEPLLTCSSANVKVGPVGMDSVSSQHQLDFTDAGRFPFPVSNPLQQAMELYSSSLLAAKHTATNFSLFSRSAVETKANLHVVGESSGPTNAERVRQQSGMLQKSSAATPTAQLPSLYGTAQGCGVQAGCSLSPLLTSPPIPHRSRSFAEHDRSIDPRTEGLPPPPPTPTGGVHEAREGMHVNKDTTTDLKLSNSAVLLSEKALETAEQTLTSPPQCSGSSAERSGKGTDSSIKRKRALEVEDLDDQSEDTGVDKKSPAATKRSRTAEAHNMSEKKRRVKINDKLRTLQGLIPNGSKPDKASLLDSVIEYIKLLQSQLQIMSMRTGIGIPSWMMPNADMQHLQMPALPPMRFSMDMGMGMGLMDGDLVSVGGLGRAPMPVLQFSGQPSAVHCSHAAGDHSQAPQMGNPHILYVAPSQFQHPPANTTIEQSVPMYSAFMPPLQPQPQPRLNPQPSRPLPLQPRQPPSLPHPHPLPQQPHHQHQQQ